MPGILYTFIKVCEQCTLRKTSDIVCVRKHKKPIKPHTTISLPVSLINHYFPLGMLALAQ